MWRDIDFADVKKCWADELRIFSVDQVGIAVDGLKQNNFPPTLPEFLQLCGRARKAAPREFPQATNAQLPSIEQCNTAEALAAKERRMANAGGSAAPSNDWAHRILERAANGEHIPADSMRMARSATA